MHKVRFRYSKVGRAKYISHLDLMATMQRSFLRAGIKLKYSEGFNPHPYMSVALPLSVGCESVCELIDIALFDDTIPDVGLLKLSDGIEVIEAYQPVRKFSEISWIKIAGKLHYDKRICDDLLEELKRCLTKDNIVISKKTKRGQKDLDIAPYIKNVELANESEGYLSITAEISAQNPTIKAEDLTSAIGEELKPVFSDFRRIGIYDSSMVLFK